MNQKIGENAPDFELLSSSNELIKLSDFIGKTVLVYFYPKDMTPGCTTQACDFRDNYTEFLDLNCVILGISPDSQAKHEKFIEKYNLPFHLLVDDNHKVAEEYGVWKLKKNFGKEYMGIERSTFVINKEGYLVKEWRKVRVKDHVKEALDYIKNNLS